MTHRYDQVGYLFIYPIVVVCTVRELFVIYVKKSEVKKNIWILDS